MILQHPLFDSVLKRKDANGKPLYPSLDHLQVNLHQLANGGSQRYHDPLGDDELGRNYAKRWIAAMAPLTLELRTANGERKVIDTGLKVIVQEDYEAAIDPVRRLGKRLLGEGLLALAIVVIVILAMWGIVLRAMREGQSVATVVPGRMEPTPVHDRSTVAAPRRRG
jgi:hypothetical protein